MYMYICIYIYRGNAGFCGVILGVGFGLQGSGLWI